MQTKCPRWGHQCRRGLTTLLPLLPLLLLAPKGHADSHNAVPYFPAASDPLDRQGFVRVINHSNLAGSVEIVATDDNGTAYPAISLSLAKSQTIHFNSGDLEDGNAAKGLSGGVGSGTGDWRLAMSSALDIEVLAYIRTRDGFLTAIHDIVAVKGRHHRVPIFNPGSNSRQASSLRLVNTGYRDAGVKITGVDDDGKSPGEPIMLTIPTGAARTFTAAELEAGSIVDGEGRLGDGKGKWQLVIDSGEPLLVMSLLTSPTGHLTNLSRSPYEPRSLLLCNESEDWEGHDNGGASRAEASDLGNISGLSMVRVRQGTVAEDRSNYYRFTLDDDYRIRVELNRLTGNANLYVLDADGRDRRVCSGRCESSRSGTSAERVVGELEAGVYYIRVNAAAGSDDIDYELRYNNDSSIPGRTPESALGLGDLSGASVVRMRQGKVNLVRNQSCLWEQNFYRFMLHSSSTIRTELRNLTGNADLRILDADGLDRRVCSGRCESSRSGTSAERVVGELEAGVYYIRVNAAAGSDDIDYELRYSDDTSISGRTRTSAFDLGNLSEADAGVRSGRVNAERNDTNLFSEAYYKFRLDGTRTIEFKLWELTGNADLYLLDFDGHRITSSSKTGTSDEEVKQELQQGIYYVRVIAQGSRDVTYRLNYRKGED